MTPFMNHRSPSWPTTPPAAATLLCRLPYCSRSSSSSSSPHRSTTSSFSRCCKNRTDEDEVLLPKLWSFSGHHWGVWGQQRETFGAASRFHMESLQTLLLCDVAVKNQIHFQIYKLRLHWLPCSNVHRLLDLMYLKPLSLNLPCLNLKISMWFILDLMPKFCISAVWAPISCSQTLRLP